MQRFVEDIELARWKEVLSIGHVYIFKNVIINENPWKFKVVPIEYRMTLKEKSHVEEAKDDGSISMMRQYLTRLDNLIEIDVEANRLTGLVIVILTYSISYFSKYIVFIILSSW